MNAHSHTEFSEIAFIGSKGGIPFDIRAPFIKSDAGRSLSKRPRQTNDCTVRALSLVAGIDYDLAYDIVAERGRKSAKGYWFPFGRKTVKSGPMPEAGVSFRWQALQAVKGEWRVNPVTFAQSHPVGRFVLRTAKHVLVCINGTIYDTHKPDPCRCVYGAWEVTPITAQVSA